MPLGEKDSLADLTQVNAVAAELALAGTVTVDRIAMRLGISTRTLQRQLLNQGISLRALVIESRMQIARVLLCKTDLDVQEIAARTGYSTPSSFGRAFSRWSGFPPQAFRNTDRKTNRL
jgi:AraC-like DNA-binding protein